MSKKRIPLAQNKPTKVSVKYDEKSPITGNFSVLTEPVTLEKGDTTVEDLYKICMETGYQTYWESWKETDTELVRVIESQMPKHVANHKHVDAFGRVWYPMMVISYTIAFYPFVDSDNQLKWALSKVSKVESESELDGKYQIIQLAVTTEDGPRMALFKILPPDHVWELNQFGEAFDYYQTIIVNNS